MALKNRLLFYFSIFLIAYLLVVRVCLIFSYSIDLDGAEFTFVHYIQQLLKGEPLYLNPYESPYSITIYTPLYLNLVEKICRILSIDYITNIYRIFIIGRILSFAFTLLGLFGIYIFAKKIIKKQSVVAFICAFYLLLLTGHSYAVRPDAAKISFFILFFYFYIDYIFLSENKNSKWLSLIFAIAAVAAKQDAIIYILLVQGVALLYNRKMKEMKLLLLFVSCSIILFLLLRIIYGKYCLTSLFLFNIQGISNFKKSYNLLIAVFNIFRLFPFIILIFYSLFISKPIENARLLKFLAIVAGLSGCLSSMFLFRPGSYLNYTYEWIVISIFMLIVFLKSSPIQSKTLVSISAIYMLFIFISNTTLNNYTINFKKEDQLKEKYSTYFQLRKDILPLLATGKSIFNPELELSLFIADKNVIYGQEYHLNRLIYGLLGLTSTSKLLCVSSEKYDALFNNKKVDYIVTKNTSHLKEVMENYYPMYELNMKKGNFEIYIPKK